MTIDISVIIPTFNRAHLISDTINSIINQSLQPNEIIVIDDGSIDETEMVVANYGKRVKYIKIDNSGVCHARNAGVDVAKNNWVAFCDSDDIWEKNKLTMQAALVHSEPKLEYCFTNFKIIYNGEWSKTSKFDELPRDFWGSSLKRVTQNSFIITEPFYHKILTRQPIFPSTIMMNKYFFNRVGGFNVDLGREIGEDFEFTLRCVHEFPIGVINVPVVGIRKHESNFSKGKSNDTEYVPEMSHMIGDVKILNYSANNHYLGRKYKSIISEQIIKRSSDVASGAFLCGNFAVMKLMLKNIPFSRRNLKMWVKILITKLPIVIAKRIQNYLT